MNAAHAQSEVHSGRYPYVERRTVSRIDEGREPERVFGTSAAWRGVLARAARASTSRQAADVPNTRSGSRPSSMRETVRRSTDEYRPL